MQLPCPACSQATEQRFLYSKNGYDILLTQHQLADMPREATMKSARLFASEVIPAFKEVAHANR